MQCFIVGYQQGSFTNQGYNMGSASFLKIGTAPEDMTLGDLVPNEAFYNAESKITFVSAGGGNARAYNDYFKKTLELTFVYQKAKDTEAKEDGWYLNYDVSDEGGYCNMNSYKIPYGQGFLIRVAGTAAGQTLTYSGEVKKTPTTASIPNQGYNILGNCTPVKIKLGDLTPNTAFYDNESKITFVSAGGGNAKYYSDYFKKEVEKTFIYQKANETEAKQDGWYLNYDVSDEGGYCNMNNLVELEAGEGFFVRRGGADASQRIEVPPAIEDPSED